MRAVPQLPDHLADGVVAVGIICAAVVAWLAGVNDVPEVQRSKTKASQARHVWTVHTAARSSQAVGKIERLVFVVAAIL